MKNKLHFGLLLIFYLIVVIIFSENRLVGDEGRYILFAKNLSQGFYSPPPPNINLWNGPGYPLFLIPFVLISKSHYIMYMRFANAFLFFFAVILLFKTLKYYVTEKMSLIGAYALGLMFPFVWAYLPKVLTEIFSIFLMCGFIYFLSSFYQTQKNIYLTLSSFFLAILALTRVIFGYVILTTIFFYAIFYLYNLIKKTDTVFKYRKILYVLIFSLFLCFPYLLYTYKLTGKVFFWSDSGGLSLYWMSTPYPDELGDWYGAVGIKQIKTKKDYYLETHSVFQSALLYARDSSMRNNHGAFFNSIKNLDNIQKDEALKRKAIENIKNHPKKFIKNWIANIGRFFFHYPFSYRDQTINTYVVLIPAFILLFLFLFTFIFNLKDIKNIPFELSVVLLSAFIYFAGSSLVSAYSRFSFVLYPVFILWISFVVNNKIYKTTGNPKLEFFK